MSKTFKILRLSLCIVVLATGLRMLQVSNTVVKINNVKTDNALQTKETAVLSVNTKIDKSDYLPICLESKADDSKAFNKILVVSKSYLAVGDPEANKVIIYKNSKNNRWNRIHEIYPPKGSVANRIGYGFGSKLAINNETLAIKAFGLGWQLEGHSSFDLAEVFSVPLNKAKRDLIPKKIKYPYPEKTSVYSVSFLNQKIAFTARKITNSEQGINQIYIADPISGKIVKTIAPSEIQYTDTDKSDSFYAELSSYKDSLILGDLRSYWSNSFFRIYPSGKLEKIIFNNKKVNGEQAKSILPEYGLLTFATSDKLVAIGRNFLFDSNTLVFRGFTEVFQPEIFASSGVLDANKSYVLISHRTPPGSMPSYKEGQPDHTLIKVNAQEIAVSSVITWERHKFDPSNYKSPFLKAVGVIGDKGLFLEAEGKVLYLPFKNLPERYEIKLSICGE